MIRSVRADLVEATLGNFRMVDRETGFLLPPSIKELVKENDIARFVVEVVDALDLEGITRQYRGTGSAAYHPRMMVALLIYGYISGVFSSRKLEEATWHDVRFRFIAVNEHPDHDTIAAFRRRFIKEIEPLFVQVLVLAQEMGFLKMGKVALDGTKIHANASRHSALSYEYAGKIEAQLMSEVADLMAQAEAADMEPVVPDGMSIPEEICRREERAQKMREARARIKERARERYERELAEFEAKAAAREAKAAATGKKPGGKPPEPPSPEPRPTDQINLTDDESRIMPVPGRGFDQCYNAQAAVATDSMLVVGTEVSQAPNDKQQVEPALEKLEGLPESLGKPDALLADAGYFRSKDNVEACEKAGIEPMIPPGRQPHCPPLSERFGPAPEAPENPTPVEAMAHPPQPSQIFPRSVVAGDLCGSSTSDGIREFLQRQLVEGFAELTDPAGWVKIVG